MKSIKTILSVTGEFYYRGVKFVEKALRLGREPESLEHRSLIILYGSPRRQTEVVGILGSKYNLIRDIVTVLSTRIKRGPKPEVELKKKPKEGFQKSSRISNTRYCRFPLEFFLVL